MSKLIIICSILYYSLLANAAHAQCDPSRSFDEYFCISPEMAPNSIISERDFVEIPKKILALFSQELKSKKYPVQFDTRWNSPYFGAGVSLYNQKFNIVVFGGMARIDGMTKEAYATVICHELGHIIGGAPYSKMKGYEWSSIEGQADFFAASVCLPRYFISLGVGQKSLKNEIEASAYEFFETVKFVSSETKNQPLIRWHATQEVAKETIQGYPSIQCRYENYRESSVRPACWFKQ